MRHGGKEVGMSSEVPVPTVGWTGKRMKRMVQLHHFQQVALETEKPQKWVQIYEGEKWSMQA